MEKKLLKAPEKNFDVIVGGGGGGFPVLHGIKGTVSRNMSKFD